MATAVINLLPKQTEAWEAWESEEITELGYGGAAGGGKTRLGCYLAIMVAEQYPGSRGAIGRKELKTLRLTTIASLFEILKELGYSERDYRYDAQQSVLHFPNGSQIYFLDTAYSPQDPEYTRFGSLEITWAWIDESNETPEKAKSILKTRVGRKNDVNGLKIKPFWLETFNPNKGHVHRDYYKPWKEGTLPPYRDFIRALPGDNPHLPQAYLDNLERSDKITRERLLKGNFEFDDDPQKVMFYESILDLSTNTLVNNPDTKVMVADIARFGGDKIVFGLFNGMNLYGLYVYTYQGIDETIAKMKSIIIEQGIGYMNVLADEDGIGGGVVDGMRGIKGFTGNATPLPIWDFVKNKLVPANYRNFRSQCYFKLGETVNSRNMSIKITKFVTNIEGYTQEKALSDIVEELDAIKSTDNSMDSKLQIIPKSEIKEQLGRSPDFADVLMMRMFFEIKDVPLTFTAQLRDEDEQEKVNPAE
jgi:hypothetical protein